MILLVHMLLGALIGQKIANPFIAVILAFLGHYFLDLFPHAEYSVDNITEKRWKKALPDIAKVILDFSTGIFLIFFFSNNNPIVYVCAFFAILPDGLSVLHLFFKNRALGMHKKIHHDKVHFLKHKKISNLWKISSQIITVIICLFIFRH